MMRPPAVVASAAAHVACAFCCRSTKSVALSEPSPRGSEMVLLVEDERAVRYLTRLILERAGYTVIAAANPAEAQVAFASHGDEIDLVITDVVMTCRVSSDQSLLENGADRIG
jgi:PleD family two-component response regulator